MGTGSLLLLATLEGEDWLEQGEFLTLLFTLIAKVSPLWLQVSGRRALISGM